MTFAKNILLVGKNCHAAIYNRCKILILCKLPSQRGRHAPFVTSYRVDREDKRRNNKAMLPTLKNNAAAGYKGELKIELLKGAGLLLSKRSRSNFQIAYFKTPIRLNYMRL